MFAAVHSTCIRFLPIVPSAIWLKKVTPGPGKTECSPSKLSTSLLRWCNLLLALLPRVQWGIIFVPGRGRNVPCSLPPSFFLSIYVPCPLFLFIRTTAYTYECATNFYSSRKIKIALKWLIFQSAPIDTNILSLPLSYFKLDLAALHHQTAIIKLSKEQAAKTF